MQQNTWGLRLKTQAALRSFSRCLGVSSQILPAASPGASDDNLVDKGFGFDVLDRQLVTCTQKVENLTLPM